MKNPDLKEIRKRYEAVVFALTQLLDLFDGDDGYPIAYLLERDWDGKVLDTKASRSKSLAIGIFRSGFWMSFNGAFSGDFRRVASMVEHFRNEMVEKFNWQRLNDKSIFNEKEKEN